MMEKAEEANKVLTANAKNGLISEEVVLMEMERRFMAIRKEMLSQHKYKITHETENGRWRTYVPCDDNKYKRKILVAHTKEELLKKITAYYEEMLKKPKTMQDAYELWLKVHASEVSENSLYKYQTDYKRFFKDTDFFKMELVEVDKAAVNAFIRDRIDTLNLCKSACKRLIQYIRNVIDTAREADLVKKNPMEFVRAKTFYKFCRQNPRHEVISDEEVAAILKQLEEDHIENPLYIPSYAVEFGIYTFTRVGEIAALRWDDVNFERNVIHIWQAEYDDRLSGTNRIGSTKNGKDRYFPLTPEIKELLGRVREAQKKMGIITEYIFSNEKGRVHKNVISSCIKAKCRQLGIRNYGIHAFRGKGNSELKSDGVSTMASASLLGHSPEVNNMYYTFDVTDFERKREAVERVHRRIHNLAVV